MYKRQDLDKTHAQGVELSLDQRGFGLEALDIRANITFTEAEVAANSADPSTVGNTYPRMPKWRTNLLATYHLNDALDVAVSLRHASDSYGRLDNSDDVDNVYGAQDGYSHWGSKVSYDVNKNVDVSVGIDNIFNDVDYVAHPWPGRNVYMSMSFDM